MAFYLASGLVCHLYITMAVGAILTVLDVIAVIVDQKKKTVLVGDENIKIEYDENNDIIHIKNEMDK